MKFFFGTMHHFVHVIHKDKYTGKSCFFTFGLKTHKLLNPKRFGAKYGTSYSGTILQGPDFSDLKCTAKVNKCMDTFNADKERCKQECVGVKGIMQIQNGRVLLGKVAEGDFGFKYKGNLNVLQARILNFFVKHATLRSQNHTQWKEYEMPYTFSFLSDVCPSMNWGDKEYFNCQKFAFLFYAKPEDIWKMMQPKDYHWVSEDPAPQIDMRVKLVMKSVMRNYFTFLHELVMELPRLIDPVQVYEISACGYRVIFNIISNDKDLKYARQEDLKLFTAALLFGVMSNYLMSEDITEKTFLRIIFRQEEDFWVPVEHLDLVLQYRPVVMAICGMDMMKDVDAHRAEMTKSSNEEDIYNTIEALIVNLTRMIESQIGVHVDIMTIYEESKAHQKSVEYEDDQKTQRKIAMRREWIERGHEVQNQNQKQRLTEQEEIFSRYRDKREKEIVGY